MVFVSNLRRLVDLGKGKVVEGNRTGGISSEETGTRVHILRKGR